MGSLLLAAVVLQGHLALEPIDPGMILPGSSLSFMACWHRDCSAWQALELRLHLGEVVCLEPPLDRPTCWVAVLRPPIERAEIEAYIRIDGPGRVALISCRGDELRSARIVLGRDWLGTEDAISYWLRVSRPQLGICWWRAVCGVLGRPR